MSFLQGPAWMPPDAKRKPEEPERPQTAGWMNAPVRADKPAQTSAVLAGQTYGGYLPEDAPLPKQGSAVIGAGNLSPEPMVKAVKQKEEEDKKAAEQRSKFFGSEGNYAAQEMSVDAYLTLTPRQRAVVDANTALITASKEDNDSWAKKPDAGQWDENYRDQVKQAFGETGGSDTYAPRTMAVLKDLGLDLNGKDLDQYLNHSALVTADDLNSLAPGATAAQDNPRQQNAVAFAEKASARLSQTLAAGQTLLDSIRTGTETGKELFGAPATADPVGFTDSPRDEDLRKAFDVFSQVRSQEDLTPERVSSVYAELQQNHNVTPNEVAKYFDTRLQASEYGDGALAPRGTNVEYLSPADFRSKFLMRGE